MVRGLLSTFGPLIVTQQNEQAGPFATVKKAWARRGSSMMSADGRRSQGCDWQRQARPRMAPLGEFFKRNL